MPVEEAGVKCPGAEVRPERERESLQEIIAPLYRLVIFASGDITLNSRSEEYQRQNETGIRRFGAEMR